MAPDAVPGRVCRFAPCIAVAGWLLLALLSLPGTVSATAAIAAGGAADAAIRQQALELANDARAGHGLPPLQLADRLNRVAQGHAVDMAQRGYFGHASPEGATVDDRFRAAGGSPWLLAAENLARCDGCGGAVAATRLARLQTGWMASADHRRNLLAAGVDRFGFGLAQAGDRLYAVQVFAGPGLPLSADGEGAAAPAQAVPPGIAADLVRQRVNAARRAAGVAPLAPATDLDRAAGALLPGPGVPLALPPGAARDALPAPGHAEWAELMVLAAGCSGCGTAVTDADLAAFAGRWLAAAGGGLLRPNLTHLGLAAAAPDRGRKAAVLVAGRRF